MGALDPEVVDAVWSAVEALLPPPPRDDHPLGCHRPRVDDRTCFEAILVRLVTRCSWVDIERLMGNRVSDTTRRARRDGWVASGLFDALADEALAAYDRMVGLDLADCSVDASLQKAPRAQDEIGPSPVDRAKRGWKWSLFADRNGIPLGWVAAGAKRNDCVLLEPTLAAVVTRGLAAECEALHLDRGYDNSVVRAAVAAVGVAGLVCARVRPRGEATTTRTVPLGLRWRSSAPTLGFPTSDSSVATPTGVSRTASPNWPSQSSSCSRPSSSTGATAGPRLMPIRGVSFSLNPPIRFASTR